MKSWDDIVKSGIIPEDYIKETTPGKKTGRSRHFFESLSPEEADRQGQLINSAIRQARGRSGPKGEIEDTPEYMKWESWSDEELARASTFFHTAPKHARPNIEINGLRPNLTSTIGHPRELKQRYGVFGNRHNPEISYGLGAAIPDDNGVKRADIYLITLPVTDLRIDPYAYPYSERTIKTHEFQRVGHAVAYPEKPEEIHEGKEEECARCK